MAAYHPSAAAAGFYYAAADFYGATEENVAPPTDAYLLPRAGPTRVLSWVTGFSLILIDHEHLRTVFRKQLLL